MKDEPRRQLAVIEEEPRLVFAVRTIARALALGAIIGSWVLMIMIARDVDEIRQQVGR